jgi:hypothetical protein
MNTQEAPLNTWWCWKRTTTDFLKATSSCMATLDSRISNHGFTTIKRYVRNSSSMTLNEALCGRQPDLFIYLYKLWQVYIVFSIWKFQVTSYHCSNKCHNHMLYALIYIYIHWVSTLLLEFWETCRPLFCVVFRVFLFVSLERNIKHDPFWF